MKRQLKIPVLAPGRPRRPRKRVGVTGRPVDGVVAPLHLHALELVRDRMRGGERGSEGLGVLGLGQAEDGRGGEATGAEVGVCGLEELVGGAGGVELLDEEGGGGTDGGVDAGEEGVEEVAELRREEVSGGAADEDDCG